MMLPGCYDQHDSRFVFALESGLIRKNLIVAQRNREPIVPPDIILRT